MKNIPLVVKRVTQVAQTQQKKLTRLNFPTKKTDASLVKPETLGTANQPSGVNTTTTTETNSNNSSAEEAD